MKLAIEGTFRFGVPSMLVSQSLGRDTVPRFTGAKYQVDLLQIRDQHDVVFLIGDGTDIQDLLGNGLYFLNVLKNKADEEQILHNVVALLRHESVQPKIFVYLRPDNNSLIISRDELGLVPIYFARHSSGDFFFSTNFAYLLKHTLGENRINRSVVEDYLAGNTTGKPYSTETFYSDIHAILPGTVNEFTVSGIRTERYGELNPSKWSHLNTDKEFADVQRQLFTKSFEALTKNEKQVGAHLSGGLDSSSNVAVFKHLYPNKSIKSFFHETKTESSDEFVYAQTVATNAGSELFVVFPGTNHLEAAYLMTRLFGQPITMINSPVLHMDTLAAIKNEACNLVLTGHGGDNVVGYGFKHLSDLLDKKSWKEVREAFLNFSKNDLLAYLHPQWYSLSVEKKTQLISLYFYSRRTRELLRKGAFTSFFTSIAEAKTYLNLPVKMVVAKNLQILRSWIRQKFTGIPRKFLKNSAKSEKQPVLANDEYPFDLLYQNFVQISEEFFWLGHHFDLEIRHPFINSELYEFCLAVPERVKFGNGVARAHHREAMKGILPDSVRLRSGKAYFNDYGFKCVIEFCAQSKDLLKRSKTLWEFVDRDKFESAIARIESEGNKLPQVDRNSLEFNVLRVLFLAVWLDLFESGALA